MLFLLHRNTENETSSSTSAADQSRHPFEVSESSLFLPTLPALAAECFSISPSFKRSLDSDSIWERRYQHHPAASEISACRISPACF